MNLFCYDGNCLSSYNAKSLVVELFNLIDNKKYIVIFYKKHKAFNDIHDKYLQKKQNIDTENLYFSCEFYEQSNVRNAKFYSKKEFYHKFVEYLI